MIRNRSSTASLSVDALNRALAAGLLLLAVLPAAAASHPQNRLLLARPYPIEAAASFPGGLFHWIDSLAGTTVGKTVPAHRAEYLRLFGGMTNEDRTHLHAFVAARAEHAGREGTRLSAMLGIFCGSATVDGALATLRSELTPAACDGLSNALAHFRPKYEVVWNDGAVPKAFLASVRRDPGRLKLEALLSKIVLLYGVDPLSVPPPRLALVPVPSGYGTHAEAIGGVLLLEIRKGEGLADEAAVVVHENSHFLWGLVPEERRLRLEEAAGEGGAATRTLQLLGEAIPTALGQGVADHSFRPSSWSVDDPWYHVEDVDTCAKRIYPTISAALEAGLTLDGELLRRVIDAANGHPRRAFLSPPGPEPILPAARRAVGPARHVRTTGWNDDERQSRRARQRPDRFPDLPGSFGDRHLRRREDHPGAGQRLRVSRLHPGGVPLRRNPESRRGDL